jgi:hypothetical protein
MEIDIEFIFISIIQALKVFLTSGFFWWVKFFLAIYVSVIFIDIVLLLMVRGLGGDIRNTLKGTQMPLIPKSKIRKKWMAIEKRLQFNNIYQNKIAILEADKLANNILLNIGYAGANMKERLEKADNKQLEELDSLVEAHEVRNKIIYDDNFQINKEEAERVMGLYRKFLDDLEII